MKPTILIVDDEEAVRGFVCRVLEQGGFSVLQAATPAEAFELFDSGRVVDLLVTDVHMPLVSGLQLAAALLLKRPELPVIFISGYPKRGLIDSFAGSARFLAKPFPMSLLLATARELLSRPT